MWTKRESAPMASSGVGEEGDDVVARGGLDLVYPMEVDVGSRLMRLSASPGITAPDAHRPRTRPAPPRSQLSYLVSGSRSGPFPDASSARSFVDYLSSACVHVDQVSVSDRRDRASPCEGVAGEVRLSAEAQGDQG